MPTPMPGSPKPTPDPPGAPVPIGLNVCIDHLQSGLHLVTGTESKGAALDAVLHRDWGDYDKPSDQWKFETAEAGGYFITNISSGMRLTFENSGSARRPLVKVVDSQDVDTERWTVRWSDLLDSFTLHPAIQGFDHLAVTPKDSLYRQKGESAPTTWSDTSLWLVPREPYLTQLFKIVPRSASRCC
ncbi:hypothetical protein ACFZB6_20690 [Streptomyces syringium]|uniref:hypothetical protein n=1 Tax=Streptomyces syringium TaxID=76729 RepID=UPI0033BA0254